MKIEIGENHENLLRYQELLANNRRERKKAKQEIMGVTQELAALLQATINKLYEATVQQTQGEYIQHLEKQLVQAQTENEKGEIQTENWLNLCANAIDDFLQLTGLKGMDVYTRHKRSFEMVFPKDCRIKQSGTDKQVELQEGRFLFKDFWQLLDNDCTSIQGIQNYFLITRNIPSEVMQKCFISEEHNWLYYASYDFKDVKQSVLLAVKGEVREPFTKILEVFCSSFARTIAIYSLMEALANRQEEFEDFLAREIHQINTSRSIADKCVETLQVDSLNFEEKRKKIRSYIGEDGRISMRLAGLSDSLTIKKKKLELRTIIKKIASDLKPKADAVPCHFSFTGSGWDQATYVYASERSLHDIFENILDNAIKYSFGDRPFSARQKGSVIEVHLEKHGMDVVTSVSNYGIGIPEDMQKKIEARVPFSRSEITDPVQRVRSGSGLGLVIVQEELERCNGYLIVKSTPPRDRTTFGQAELSQLDNHNLCGFTANTLSKNSNSITFKSFPYY